MEHVVKKTLIVDIGSWTIDIMPVINKSPDESKCVTIPRGLITCIEEEKAANHLADILRAYGIDVSAEEIRSTETEQLKTTVREKVEVR